MKTDQKVLTSPVPDAIRYSGRASTVCGTMTAARTRPNSFSLCGKRYLSKA